MTLTFRKLEVENLRQLEGLVTESLTASGLSILGSRLLLGQSAVDLVAADARGSLVLVVLAFTADDATLLRIVDACSWCQESVGGLRQLYPSARVDGRLPRMILVAGRLPDAFLRKVRLLMVPELACFEYRYVEVNGTAGFYLDTVDWQRRGIGDAPAAPVVPPTPREAEPAGAAPRPEEAREPRTAAEPAVRVSEAAKPEVPTPRPEVPTPAPLPEASPAPAPPVAAPATRTAGTTRTAGATRAVVADRAPAGADAGTAPAPAASQTPATRAQDRQALLQGLHMPPEGELSPSWRRLLDKPADTFDETKIRAVRDYLQRELPQCSVYDFYDLERASQAFHLQNSQGRLVHLVFVASELLEDRSETELGRFLAEHRLSHVLRLAGHADVMVTGDGVSVSGR